MMDRPEGAPAKPSKDTPFLRLVRAGRKADAKCSACLHFRPTSPRVISIRLRRTVEQDLVGRCRARNPEAGDLIGSAIWPIMSASDWCGGWEPKV